MFQIETQNSVICARKPSSIIISTYHTAMTVRCAIFFGFCLHCQTNDCGISHSEFCRFSFVFFLCNKITPRYPCIIYQTRYIEMTINISLKKMWFILPYPTILPYLNLHCFRPVKGMSGNIILSIDWIVDLIRALEWFTGESSVPDDFTHRVLCFMCSVGTCI